jgi:hypothetical protein
LRLAAIISTEKKCKLCTQSAVGAICDRCSNLLEHEENYKQNGKCMFYDRELYGYYDSLTTCRHCGSILYNTGYYGKTHGDAFGDAMNNRSGKLGHCLRIND